MYFLGGTLLVAVAITFVRNWWKGERVAGERLMERVLVTWVIVAALSLLLFLGWCFLALSGASFH